MRVLYNCKIINDLHMIKNLNLSHIYNYDRMQESNYSKHSGKEQDRYNKESSKSKYRIRRCLVPPKTTVTLPNSEGRTRQR